MAGLGGHLASGSNWHLVYFSGSAPTPSGRGEPEAPGSNDAVLEASAAVRRLSAEVLGLVGLFERAV